MDSAPALPPTERILGIALTTLAFVLPISIAGTNIALGLVTAALAAHLAAGRPLTWRAAWTPVVWLLGLYCAVAVVTSFTGVLPSRSLHNLHKDLHKLWVLCVLLLAMKASPPRHWLAAVALGFVFIAMHGITLSFLESYQGLLAFRSFRAWVRVRAFLNPVTFGEMMALGVLGGLAFLRRGDYPFRDRRPAMILTILLSAALLLNQTRGAFLGVFAGLTFMAVAEPAMRRWIKWGVSALALAAFIASFRNYGPQGGLDPQHTRLALWDVALKIFRDHPWLGVGPSNYATVFGDYFHGLLEERAIWGSAHNIYFQQLAERGIIGLGALLALGGAFLARAWAGPRRSPGPKSLWALSAVAAFAVMNLTESAFQNEQITTLFLAVWAYTQTGEAT